MLAMLHRRHRAKLPSRTFPVKILAKQPPPTMKRRTATTPAQTFRNDTETPIPSVLVPRSIDLALPPPFLSQPRTSPPPTFPSLGLCLLPNGVRGPTYRFLWRTRAYLPLSLAYAGPPTTFSGVKLGLSVALAVCSIAHQFSSGGASFKRRLERRRWR